MSGVDGHPFEWFGVPLRLLPDRALVHERAGALLVADLHLGKPASFRAGGIPVPEGVTANDLGRLDRLIDATGVSRVVVLGDLAHDRGVLDPVTIGLITDWRERHHAVAMELVPGNHDRRLDDPGAIGFKVLDERCHLDGIDLVHAADENENAPTLGGHVHPCVRLSMFRGDRMRASCFWFRGRTGLLPAFGSFTGGYVISPGPGDDVFVVGPDEVVPIDGASFA